MFKPPFKKKKNWPTFTIEDIRKRSRLLVVDDGQFYYLDLFKKDGYNIEKWDDINDLHKLESGYYDIILLDIQGVGKKYSQDEGLGILRHLKKACPSQIVIAYSNADFSLKYKEFFDLADHVLEKQKDYVEFKRVVDKLLGSRFSLGFYLDKISKLASPYIPDSERIRNSAEKAIRQQDPDVLHKLLIQNGTDKETISIILQIFQVAIGIISLT